jgi:hypothetical protein
MLWIIVIGFVAGILARLLSSAPNKPTGFLLTTALGIAGAFVATLPWPGGRLVPTGPGRRFHRGHRRCHRRAVRLESGCSVAPVAEIDVTLRPAPR